MPTNAKPNPRALGPTLENDGLARTCDWPGCDGGGEYRAPRSRREMNSYFWFCMNHVRKYNKEWNYYAGMNESEVEADVRRDTVWRRPSWPFGSILPKGVAGNGNFKDDFGIFGDGNGHAADGEPKGTPATPPETRALGILGLRPPMTANEVKARYKELVKRHHPDANGGDKTCEERFKEINRAYQVVMEILAPF
ncbi:MAG TPA: J domain-containing protein [Alphaproteobacteria bacterium]|nr:J domain-containing protein [Alphaproteobacteria bacterium]